MLCFRKLPAAKNFMDKRGVVKTLRRKFFVSKCRKLLQGNCFVLCFRKLPVSKKIMHKRGGLSRFSVECFLYHNAENFGRGTLLCCVSENFW